MTNIIPTVRLASEGNRNTLAAAARAGEIIRVRRGAYCAPDQIRVEGPGSTPREARRTALARVRALHSQLSADHVFGYASAALLHGCRLWTAPPATHIYQRYRASGHAASDVRRHAWTISAGDVTAAAGMPVTSLARTVVDCARTLHPLDGLVIADSALAMGITRETLLEVLALLPARRGSRRARRVIELADGGAQSAWETWVRYEILRRGLPRPVTQMPVHTAVGVFHTDLGYTGWALGIEFDGRVKYRPDGVRPGHDPAQEYLDEKARAAAIRQAGITIENVSSADRRDVAAMIDRIVRHLPHDLATAARPDPLLPP
ncbi:type IV toxin-antitoxin system AbiEi family antitoxin [Promicromonospora thailandica]|uniref:Transcriptional regulator, AbiEi antitoxin, Type IV TA system n=1 Tax=Promicromonospora thailandica TaxID=765201 RepID=A0A9X2G0V7_9MICO|nr:type IV toxin-antitoxin system AbiEi family antitoxin [Promicromonospora thailandica]MCP2264970.1 Transcriptional regulator, AbiEi antitoxin, Type IV TA system [Promicromonospora thailandica]BFF18750.1 hypothetical protein GCM10025730_22710 [Promicromonospora thailandica]